MTNSPATTINCTQCGGELHPDEGQVFLTCTFCGSTVYVDKSQVVFHWSLNPTLTAEQAASALNRWMSGNQTVKDLDKKAQVTSQTFQYFPLWHFQWKSPQGNQMALQPAAATSVTELAKLRIPAGDLVRYDPALDAQSEPPTVPLETARDWLKQSQPQAAIQESALVHVPIFIFKYQFKGQSYTAVVEAATGSVIANIYPAKSEAPYITAGFVTAAVYLFLAFLPVALGFTIGLPLALGLAVIAAPFLIAFAAFIASKV
jgi:hypothetical protein